MNEHVLFSQRGAVGVIELSRPEKFNAVSRQAMTGIAAALDSFESPDSGVRAVLLIAKGKHFCTGADLEEGSERSGEYLREFLSMVHETLARFESTAMPVVAACRGMALAGGLELLLACDVVFASDAALFGDQHVQYGLIPAWGATLRLPRRVGLGRSLDLMYSGRRIDAATALSWGLVNYVVADAQLEDAATKYCETLTTRSRPGLGAMKELARGGQEMSLSAGLQQEMNRVIETMAGPDAAEGLAAFKARRPPVFKA